MSIFSRISFKYFHAILVLFLMDNSFSTRGSPYFPVLLISTTILRKLSINWYIHSVDFSCNYTFSMTLSSSILYYLSRFCRELMMSSVDTDPDERFYPLSGFSYTGKPPFPNEIRLFFSCSKDFLFSSICIYTLDLRGLGWICFFRIYMVCIFFSFSSFRVRIYFCSLWKRVSASFRSLVL